MSIVSSNDKYNSGYERIDKEKYYTPTWVWQCLLDHVDFSDKVVWEPAAGNGAISVALASRSHFYKHKGWRLSDLYPDTAITEATDNNGRTVQIGANIATFDFLHAESTFNSNLDCHIITNPPFGKRGELAEQFIEIALNRTKPRHVVDRTTGHMPMSNGGKVAMLLRADFDSAITRQHLFKKHRAFDKKIVLLKRIKWTNVEDTASPKNNHAWYVWDWSRETIELPVIEYGY